MNEFEASTDKPILELRDITKRFGPVRALSEVSLHLRSGEIHAIVGENGAGKSTLIKILAGIHSPDSGEIWVDGQSVTIRDVGEADRLGIRVIHQELSLVPHLSIAENVFLGREPSAWGWIRRRKIQEDAATLVRELGLREIADVRREIARLSLAEKQLVEIARALSSQARILILDEPTSALSEAETDALFAKLRRLRARGTGIIYISHRLEEITRLADRVTVLRDGQSAGTLTVQDLDPRAVVRLMVGRDLQDYFHRPGYRPGLPALEIRGLMAPKVRGVDLTVRHGEILGLAGLVGSGRSELARAIFGIDRMLAGEIVVDGKPIIVRSPRDALDAGLVLVPEDRKLEGLILIQSLAFNVALPWTKLWNPPLFPDRGKRDAIVRRAIDTFRIKVSDVNESVATLSGGNQQKALVARWMEERPRVLMLDEPTRGIDVGARKEMFAILRALVEDGMGVLLISSDLSEVIHMSHRIAIYRDGRILRTVAAGETDAQEIMELLTGASHAV